MRYYVVAVWLGASVVIFAINNVPPMCTEHNRGICDNVEVGLVFFVFEVLLITLLLPKITAIHHNKTWRAARSRLLSQFSLAHLKIHKYFTDYPGVTESAVLEEVFKAKKSVEVLSISISPEMSHLVTRILYSFDAIEEYLTEGRSSVHWTSWQNVSRSIDMTTYYLSNLAITIGGFDNYCYWILRVAKDRNLSEYYMPDVDGKSVRSLRLLARIAQRKDRRQIVRNALGYRIKA